jgi:hypothetical protein
MVRANASGPGEPTLALLDRRADLAVLPLRRGPERRLTRAEATHLSQGAAQLQSLGSERLASELEKEAT